MIPIYVWLWIFVCSVLNKSIYFYFRCVTVFLPVCKGTKCGPGPLRGQKKASNLHGNVVTDNCEFGTLRVLHWASARAARFQLLSHLSSPIVLLLQFIINIIIIIILFNIRENILLGLESWFSSYKYCLLNPRTQAQFQAPLWQLATIYNFSSIPM